MPWDDPSAAPSVRRLVQARGPFLAAYVAGLVAVPVGGPTLGRAAQ